LTNPLNLNMVNWVLTLVTGISSDELVTRATEAIQIYWEVLSAERSPTSELREIEVELPA